MALLGGFTKANWANAMLELDGHDKVAEGITSMGHLIRGIRINDIS